MARYSIDAPHFYQVRYSEGDRRVRVEVDLRDVVPRIYVRSIRAWEPPHDGESISFFKREVIAWRVRHYLRAGGQRAVLDHS